jgi:hypothetical protein
MKYGGIYAFEENKWYIGDSFDEDHTYYHIHDARNNISGFNDTKLKEHFISEAEFREMEIDKILE